MSQNCQRCNTKLSYMDQQSPITFKGGYSGHFCPSCSNLWNEAYHEHPACAAYREAELKLTFLSIAIKSGNTDLTTALDAAGSLSRALDGAMKDLYYLAKEIFAPVKAEGGLMPGRIHSVFGHTKDKPGHGKADVVGGENNTKKATYVSPITGKEV